MPATGRIGPWLISIQIHRGTPVTNSHRHHPRRWRDRALRGLRRNAWSLAFLLLAGSAAVFVAVRGEPSTMLSPGDSRISEFDRRLDAMEARQAEQMDRISRQLAALGGRPPPTPGQLRAREKQREHLRRVREDPAYARQVQAQRLADLQRQFDSEPMDHRWSVEARSMTTEAMAAAAARAGAKIENSRVDCRSATCRIDMDVPAGHSYEDVLTYLMTDLAELLPHARLVVMPPSNGIQRVHVFADKSRAAAASYAQD